MKCIKCGNDILKTDNFCDACGARVNDVDPTPKSDTVTTNTVSTSSANVKNASNTVDLKENSLEENDTPITDVKDSDASIDANYIDEMLNNDNNNPTEESIGFHISEEDLFDNSTSTVEVKSNNFFKPRHSSFSTTYKDRNVSNGKKYIITGVVGILCFFLIVLGISLLSNSTTSLVCESKEGSISIKFSDDDIVGYAGKGVSYNVDEQREIFKKIGLNQYISQFNDWFTSNTSGSCKYDDKQIVSSPKNDNSLNLSDNVIANYSATTVGDDFYGRVDIPTNWTRFYDASGNGSLQYSYADVFIVSLDVIEGGGYTAEEHATSYALKMKEDSNVSDVTTSTVKIGKNNEYTAYQVYMYYPSFSEYLITYWFDTGNGDIHYIALEGPSEANSMKLTDFLAIPQSFH